jgi:hypothetical protein
MCVQNCSRDEGTTGPNTVAKLNMNKQETMTQEREFHTLLITNTSTKEKEAIQPRQARFKD